MAISIPLLRKSYMDTIEVGTRLKAVDAKWWEGTTVDDIWLVTAVDEHQFVIHYGTLELIVHIILLGLFEVVP
ncbi:hypothetical protein [Pseudomonas serbica]|uniref:hypothetical protein n=1 Tax=Pseudomonas serbica TaxID=2965074 RepID=UPI00237A49A0|nr:hypothetical protein [Pseudomonas serbica]